MVGVGSWMSIGKLEFGLNFEVRKEADLEVEADFGAELGLAVGVGAEVGVGMEVVVGKEAGVGMEAELGQEAVHVEPRVQRNCCKYCSFGLEGKAEGCEGNHVRWKNENHFGLRLQEV